jgi:uncharacterized protein (TIGR00255 family)
MLKSMTAYATNETNEQNIFISVEIRTYNSRHLDIMLRRPSGYLNLEEKIKGLLSSAIVRGRVEVRLKITDDSETAGAYEVDLNKAKAYFAALEQLKSALNLKGGPSLDSIAAVPGVLQPAENGQDSEASWPSIVSCMQPALDELDRMRRQEGAFLEKDFLQRLERMEQGIDQIGQMAAGLVDQYREKLLARIDALTQGTVELDPMRVAQETALLADRSDISEEIVRARSHIAQFRTIMEADEPAGRKLNFLLQEFNREFNTMGSKIGQADIAHIVVDMKAEIEKMREQVQNIE